MFTNIVYTFILLLFFLGNALADNDQRALFKDLLPPKVSLGMSHKAFNALNLKGHQIPGMEESPNALIFITGSSIYKNYSLLFIDDVLASVTCSWKSLDDGVKDFIRTNELLRSISGKMVNIEIGKFTRTHDAVRLNAQLFNLNTGVNILVQANDLEISMILFDEKLVRGKPLFATFEEISSQPIYKNQFLQGVPLPSVKEPNKTIPQVRDYLKDGFNLSLSKQNLQVHHLSEDTSGSTISPFAPSKQTRLSIIYLVFFLLIFAGAFLLYLLHKRRR